LQQKHESYFALAKNHTLLPTENQNQKIKAEKQNILKVRGTMFSFIASNEPWLAKFSNLEFRTIQPTKGRSLPIKHEFFLDIDGETIHCEMNKNAKEITPK